MVLDGEDVLLCSLDDICMEMRLWSINFGFGFILNNLFGKFLDHSTFVTVLIQEVEVFVQPNRIKLSLKQRLLLTFDWMIVIVIVHVVEESWDQRHGDDNSLPGDVSRKVFGRSFNYEQPICGD